MFRQRYKQWTSIQTELAQPHSNLTANTEHSPKVGSVPSHCLRRWPNTEPTLGEYLVFAGYLVLGLIKEFLGLIPSHLVINLPQQQYEMVLDPVLN